MSDVTIVVRRNGPLKVTGPMAILDSEGREFALPEGSSVVLCRCGQSENKPFCDSTHKRVGFVADDAAPRIAEGPSRGDPSADPNSAAPT